MRRVILFIVLVASVGCVVNTYSNSNTCTNFHGTSTYRSPCLASCDIRSGATTSHHKD